MVNATQTPQFKLPLKEEGRRRRQILMILVSIVVLVSSAAATWLLLRAIFPPQTAQVQTTKKPVVKSKIEKPAEALKLDITKKYGNKYANGILPVGDGKYVTNAGKKGHVFACQQYVQSFTGEPEGAGSRGPWFTNNNTQYNINKKLAVKGTVNWKGSFSNTVSGNIRTIVTNDLPLAHTTGTFPIASGDPAFTYDRNPNAIAEQSITYKIDSQPTFGNPQCMGGEVGVMSTGVALFSAFDASGRDAGAWEVQDDCAGHPQNRGEYHYHTLSGCIKDISVQTVIGFALDGFPITGPQVGIDNILTTENLDECHGIQSEITLDDKKVNMYHYVMTEDFPYSVGCFRAKPIQPPVAKPISTPQNPPGGVPPATTPPVEDDDDTPPTT